MKSPLAPFTLASRRSLAESHGAEARITKGMAGVTSRKSMKHNELYLIVPKWTPLCHCARHTTVFHSHLEY